MSQPSEGEKRYDPGDSTLKFVNRPDDLDGSSSQDGDQVLRAEMSCGHAVTPESLTGWCRSLLDQGQYKFRCPALRHGTVQQCGAEWPYKEVRRVALLTSDEMRHFEEAMAHLAAAEHCEFKSCPSCKTCVEREDLTNLSVRCTVCTADKRKVFEFCWQCLKPWKGSAPSSVRCANDGCKNQELELLKSCRMTALPYVAGVDACPSIRACPTCGKMVEHDKTGCKNIICPRCQVEFCFVCLKVTERCLKTSTHFQMCSDGVAPKQTTLPIWHRN